MTITPALTKEEWATAMLGDPRMDEPDYRFREGNLYETFWDGSEPRRAEPRERHALAALALHGQPFGFTWEDVRELRDLVECWNGEAQYAELVAREFDAARSASDGEAKRMWGINAESCRRRAALAANLADRIAALLPLDEDTK